MAITGERFLELNKVEHLVITWHALARIHKHAGLILSEEQALLIFREAIEVDYEHMILMGYRPAYGRRMRQGERSWYFRFAVGDTELIAVVSDGRAAGEFVWVTSYGRNTQTDLYRVVGPGAALSPAWRSRHGQRIARKADRTEHRRRAPRARAARRVRVRALAEVREHFEPPRGTVHNGTRAAISPRS